MLDLINSLARYSIFLGLNPPSATPSETCSTYANASSSEIVNEALQIYRNETSGNGLGGIIVFSVLLIPLIVVFFVMIMLYILSARQTPKTDSKVHHSPLFTLFSCGGSDVNFADHSHMSFIAGLIQCVLVTVYFIGDNLGPLVQAHGNDFGCSNTCARNVQVTSSILSVGAILLLHQIPYLLHHWTQATVKYDYVIENEKTLLGVLGNIVKVDAAFTALTVYSDIAENCNVTENALNWIVLVLCTVGGALYITVKIINAKKDYKTGSVALLLLLGNIFLAALLFFYLASDNDTPLDCGFDCDITTPTSTGLSHPLLDRHCCNIHSNIVTRLIFTLIAIVQTTIVAVVVGVVIFSAGKGKSNKTTEKSGKDKAGTSGKGKGEVSDDSAPMVEKKTTQESEPL